MHNHHVFLLDHPDIFSGIVQSKLTGTLSVDTVDISIRLSVMKIAIKPAVYLYLAWCCISK